MQARIADLLRSNLIDRLDAEVLLAAALQVDRAYLYAHSDALVDTTVFQSLLERRQQGEPVAYIIGEKEFWGLPFKVTPATLIPRPETELLIEVALQRLSQTELLAIADLGTGSGAIALSLAHERPAWQIDAVDASHDALMVAKENQQRLSLPNVRFFEGNWCDALPQKNYHAIISNPPYIAPQDPHLQQGDVCFEPQTALIACEQGLSDIKIIIDQAKTVLVKNGLLLLEHGYDQAEAIADLLLQAGYTQIQCLKDLAGLNRAHIAMANAELFA